MLVKLTGRRGSRALLPLLCTLLLSPPYVQAAGVLLGNGSQTNHLLILFGPGQTLQYEFRHDGSIRNGEQLLAAVIQATGGLSVVTAARDTAGHPVTITSQLLLTQWNGQGLFAHFHQFSFGIFINGFASGSLKAASDGSYDCYFNYQIGGAGADFITAPIGASDRTLNQGDQDAYVLTSAFSSPGLAAWMASLGITDLTADSDGDGMDNLFEYALRKNPLIADALRPVQITLQGSGGGTFLTLTYRRPYDEGAAIPEGADGGYDGVGYTVETSTDLVTWQSGTNHVAQTVTPDENGSMATVVARVPADLSKRFLRLRVFLP